MGDVVVLAKPDVGENVLAKLIQKGVICIPESRTHSEDCSLKKRRCPSHCGLGYRALPRDGARYKR